MVVPTPVGATTHGDNPAGLRHLVIYLAERGGHLIGERAGDDHAVGLTGGGAEEDAEPGGGGMGRMGVRGEKEEK